MSKPQVSRWYSSFWPEPLLCPILFPFGLFASILIMGVMYGWHRDYVDLHASHEKSEITLTPVVRVFKHGVGRYSVMVEEEKEVKDYYLGGWGLPQIKGIDPLSMGSRGDSDWPSTSRVFADVPQDKPMYVEIFYDKVTGNSVSWDINVAIHVHSGKEFEGGSWSSGGKHPQSGDVQVVQ